MANSNFLKNQSKQIRVLYLTTLVLFLPLFAGIYFLYKQDVQDSKVIAEPEPVQTIPVSLDSVQTTAQSAIVVSLYNEQILYQKNSERPMPLASLTKLVTAKVADNQLVKEKVSIDKMKEFSEYGDGKLIEGDSWDKQELIDYTLVTSSNDGAHSLQANSKNASAFTDNMNTLVASIGLSNTYFYNETGLDHDDTGILGSKGTAKDMSKILSYLIKDNISLYEKTKHGTIHVSTPEGNQIATNTNEVADVIPGLLVSKTGYTDLAGGNLAIVADMGLNEPVAFVVLKSSREARFEDVLKLQEAYFKQVRERMR